jgi:hypothetical protein
MVGLPEPTLEDSKNKRNDKKQKMKTTLIVIPFVKSTKKE